MAYIGRQLVRGQNRVLDDISGSFNGSTTAFNLTVSSSSSPPASVNQLWIILGGILQKPGTDFTVADAVITFTTAPASTLSFWGMIQGDTSDINAPSDASVTPSKIANSGDFAFPADVRFKDADGSHYVGLQAPSTVSSNLVWTLPAADGSANQLLKTDGSGALGWASDTQSNLLDEDNMSSNSATQPASQQSIKAYVDAGDLSLIDEDNMSTNSATRPPSQQSVKAYADTKAVLTGSTDNTICTVTGANAIAGEANLTFTGTSLDFKQGNNSVNTANGNLIFSNSDTAQVAKIAGLTGSSSDDGQIRFYTKNAGTETEALRISEHSTPKLQLLAGESEIIPSASDGSLTFSADPGQNRSSTNIAFKVDASEKCRIDSNGNVQIGTTAPISPYSSNSNKLSVYKADGNGGVLELGGFTNADAYNAGQILFTNTANANDTAWQSDSKLVGLIRVETITTDSNAGDDSGGDLAFYTKAEAAAGSLKMTIHGEGYVTTPKQPCSMYKALSNSHTNNATDSTEVLLFQDVKRNEGSHYNTTNGRFTAPVAGTYFVGHNCLIDNNASDATRSADLQINGSGYVTMWYDESGGDSDYHGISGTAIVELSANDFIQIRATAGVHIGSETSFTVYLLG